MTASYDVTTFLSAVTDAFCASLAACCGTADAGACASSLAGQNDVPFTTLGLLYAGGASSVVDQGAAQECVAAFSGLLCEYTVANVELESLCAAAICGQLEEGDVGCLSSFDCVPGLYCGPIHGITDGVPDVPDGGGTCMPLVGLGSPCFDLVNSTDCVYVGGGTACAESGGTKGPALYCGPSDAGMLTCQSQVEEHGSCGTGQDQQCAEALCVDAGSDAEPVCAPSTDLSAYCGLL